MTTDSQKEPESGIGGMLEYGENINNAVFQFTAIFKEVQTEVLNVAEASGFSIKQLSINANGSHRGADAYFGKARAVLAMQAISTITGYPLEILHKVAWFQVTDPHGDKFQVELISGEKLCSKNRVDVFCEYKLITTEVHAFLTDAIEMGLYLNSFKKGDFIVSTSSKPTTSMTATQRLSGLRGLVKPRLPADVKIAKVTRVDPCDASVKWRCVDDRSRSGWVLMENIELLYSTRADEEDDDEGDDDSWLFGGCG